MLEWAGAMGANPGPLAWWELERMFLGWRRQQDIGLSRLWVAILMAAGADVNEGNFSKLVPFDHNGAARSKNGRGGNKVAVSFKQFGQRFVKK